MSYHPLAARALSRSVAAMVSSGGTGNFVDRLAGRGVVDYPHSGWFPTFYLADAFVTVGIAQYAPSRLQPPPGRNGLNGRRSLRCDGDPIAPRTGDRDVYGTGRG